MLQKHLSPAQQYRETKTDHTSNPICKRQWINYQI